MPTLQVEDIQGVVLQGYGKMAHASFLMLSIDDATAARRWLGSLEPRSGATSSDLSACTNVALSPGGLRKLGLPDDTLAMFAGEFLEGMSGSDHRQRILGDLGESHPRSWQWGGPGNADIDLVLMCYGATQAAFERLVDDHGAALAPSGLELVVRLDTARLPWRKEHFGFRDGIAQPAIEGFHAGAQGHNTVAPGEFLLGYPNAYGQHTDRPLVEPDDDPGDLLPLAAGDALARHDLGMNGSYLVFRQLGQDVAAFWRYVDEQTRTMSGERHPDASIYLASKMVGRWPGGAPLTRSPHADDAALAEENDFLYVGSGDADGLGCPIGAHVRRANPRDALDPRPGSERSIEIGKRHRIIRRGRAYGPPFHTSMEPKDMLRGDGATNEARGLHFICFNTQIGRQFEFIQHTWVNNSKFDGLYADDDPLIGDRGASGGHPAGTFTVQAQPVRKRVTGMPRFVQVHGGSYFFLPGLRALRYLASLG